MVGPRSTTVAKMRRVQCFARGDKAFIILAAGQVAQSVEQRTENPRVGSSILPLATLGCYVVKTAITGA